jgi:hypothetical protein
VVSLVFLGVHIATAVFDPHAALGPVATLIPFASAYRPLRVGLGVIAVDLGIALVVTSELRRHVGVRAWRAIHRAAQAAWPLALLHGIGAGTDSRGDRRDVRGRRAAPSRVTMPSMSATSTAPGGIVGAPGRSRGADMGMRRGVRTA